MATASSKKSSGPVLRSLSPSGRFYAPSMTSSFASSSGSSFSSTSAAFFNHHHSQYYHHVNNNHSHHNHHRSASPTRVNIYTSNPITTPSFRFSIDRSTSPNNRSIAVSKQSRAGPMKRTCMCSPTTHPGSFRCSLHKNNGLSNNHHGGGGSSFNSLNMRRSAMKNSLVRIGGVEGDWVKRALTALIRPSSHQQRRRGGFQARPSRLAIMSKAEDL
jgi:hypothetical protein